jgi:hypothetical protein
MSVGHFRHTMEVGLLLIYKMTQKTMKKAGEGGGEDDASESELNNQEGGWEDDAASTSSSESELNKLNFTRIFTTSRRPLLLNMSGATLPNFNQSGDI